jgi:hypothetical protein
MIFGLQPLIQFGQKDLSIKNELEAYYLAQFIFNAFDSAQG